MKELEDVILEKIYLDRIATLREELAVYQNKLVQLNLNRSEVVDETPEFVPEPQPNPSFWRLEPQPQPNQVEEEEEATPKRSRHILTESEKDILEEVAPFYTSVKPLSYNNILHDSRLLENGRSIADNLAKFGGEDLTHKQRCQKLKAAIRLNEAWRGDKAVAEKEKMKAKAAAKAEAKAEAILEAIAEAKAAIAEAEAEVY